MFSSQAFVIHSIPFKEADRIYTLFSREFGRISARARGVRKTTSKLGPHLLPLLPCTIEVVAGKEWYTITGAKAHENKLPEYSEVFFDFYQYCVPLFLKALPNEQENAELFDSLSVFLTHMSQKKCDIILLKSLFLMRFLEHTGHTIELDMCLRCEQKKSEYNLDIEAGGFICKDCSYEGIPISETFRKSFKILQDPKLEFIDRLEELSSEGKEFLLSVLERFTKACFPQW